MSALTKFINFLGLTAQTEELVDAMDAKDADNLQAAKSYADTVATAAGSSAAASSIPLSQKGTPGGVAELNSQGIVPSHQLPSFVDDVIEGYRLGQHFYSDAAHTTIVTDETGQSADQFSGKIYVDLGDNQTYRWAGSDYAVISESLALGTTEATAGRGDWTYTAHQHALAKGSQFASNLYKITTNAEGHVIAATPVTKQDIVDLGIPGSDTIYEDATTTTHGLMSASDKAKLDGVESGAQVNPSDATTTAHGLMSAADKAKLDGIEANANNYSLPTMSASTKGGAKLGHGLSVEDDALNLGPLTDSGSGASVQTDGCGIFGVTGEGWSEQDRTTGKNLCPNNLVDTTVSGVTFTKLPDGGIRVYGMETGSNGGTDIGQITLEPGAYTLSMSGRLVGNLRLLAYSPSTTTLYASLTNGSRTFTVQSQDNVHVYFTSTGSNYQLEDTVIYPQIEAGSTATSYEPYTGGKASPSPNYPQEIRVARGRNLLDESTIENGVISGPTEHPSTNRICTTYNSPIKVQAGSAYTVSWSAGKISSVYIDVYDSSDTLLSGGSGWIASGSSYTMQSGADHVRLTFRNVNNDDISPSDLANAQFELGSQATPYVPYGHVGLEVTHDGTTTVTPIPLPSKGWAGAAGSYKDALSVDSAGRWEWANNAGKHSGSSGWTRTSGNADRTVFSVTADPAARKPASSSTTPDLIATHFIVRKENAGWAPGDCSQDSSNGKIYAIVSPTVDTAEDFASAITGLEIYYALATPTAEHGYIQLPELPNGATVSIPELEAIGVEWWVEGTEAIIEHTSSWAKRIEALEAIASYSHGR